MAAYLSDFTRNEYMASTYDVVIVGGGVAGRTTGLFTARHDLDTLILDAGSSILRRNAHLENYPGFPAGVDARWLLAMMREQAEAAGCRFEEAEVMAVAPSDTPEDGDRFTVETDGDETYLAQSVVAATKNAVAPFEDLPEVGIVDRGKRFLQVGERGRTDCEGFYAAGRVAGKPHQAIVAAGHGAEVACGLLDDHDAPFYHDWVAPEGYFTGRGRDVPPGCAEIDDAERQRRERAARTALRDHLAEPFPESPEQHPSVAEGE
jgi:pyruvate/2-oxoglutarate dehydrogenase complex dihydrolipoamide dehydrogenase (E3) component